MKNQKLIIIALLFVNIALAQTKNVFLERDYWKTNPSIEDIDKKIKEGNDAAESNAGGFDAVTNAIFAKAPLDVVKHLLTIEGNDVNKLTHDKRTYAFWAASNDNLELLKYLAENGARFDVKDSHKYSVLTFAAVGGVTNIEIFDLCIANGIDVKTDVNEHGANALHLIMRGAKDFSLVDYFTAKSLDINSLDEDGNGVFNYAAQSGNKEMVALLIEKGLPYKTLNKKGENALFLATRGSRRSQNSLEYLKYLEGLGLEANLTNTEGKTPLFNLASGNKDVETMKYFLSKGVDANQSDKENNNALILASGRNSLEVITLLASKTKNTNQTNKDGESALTHALSNDAEVVAFLVEKGADVKVVDAKGNNLNYYLLNSFSARKQDNFSEKLALLTKKGLEVKAAQKDGNNAFHIALDNRDALKLLKQVNDFGADVNAKNNDGLTPLHKAVMQAKDVKTVKYLISIGANKNEKTDFDESVYDLAQENEFLQANKTDINFLQ
ncbi:ankyrin repeat domain-containing protein [Tamlana sp. 2_MG-2023]|uniref:ankyrin repeat domain-containing protein n=1 Tax=unclassified Tamlana TaxID=2614803 RepID=UPI0026E402FD|nr:MULTISPECIES: ankyrin repeat domain-containing protein [unclassified Tamlana]MDO6760470.1 ankyrin repeat domain-containing protein [Tamlana sp. 2_MG-2023]MDO6790726.1 ankyrin repeat domain-containing protein [Tamlana sp. 1_MG-2023]